MIVSNARRLGSHRGCGRNGHMVVSNARRLGNRKGCPYRDGAIVASHTAHHPLFSSGQGWPLPNHTTSACCVTKQNDKNPRGWGKGVFNTPLHAVTEYTDIVSYEIRPLCYRKNVGAAPRGCPRIGRFANRPYIMRSYITRISYQSYE